MEKEENRKKGKKDDRGKKEKGRQRKNEKAERKTKKEIGNALGDESLEVMRV